MKLWPEIKAKIFLSGILVDPEVVKYWAKIFQSRYEGTFSTTWDVQWTFACWINSSLGILSNSNLISNIGFGAESTHTSFEKSKYANISVEAMDFPLKHPPFVIRDREADNFTQKTLFKQTRFQNFKTKIKKIVRG
jgi:hypothetical protein